VPEGAADDKAEIRKLKALLEASRAALRRSHTDAIRLEGKITTLQQQPDKPVPQPPQAAQDPPLPGWLNLYGIADQLAKKVVAAAEREGFIPDVAIGHDTHSLETLELLKQRFGTVTIFDAMEMPVLAQRTGSYFRKLPRPAHEMMQSRIDHNIQRVDRVITVGPAMARRLREVYHRDVEAVLNSRAGPPVPRSDDLRRHVGAAEGDVLLLFGNLIGEDYGFEEVFGALAYLPEHFKLINVGGFGGRDYEEKTRKMLADSGYEHRILFGSSVPFDAVPALFSGADLGIISFKAWLSENDRYGLPNRFFDYCTAGIPIFTTDIEDHTKFVRAYDAGVVFDELTPEAVANAILSNMDNLPRWRENVVRMAREICWERAGAEFVESLGPPGLKVAIVIRRDITIHGRTHRAHRSLTERGHTVRVFTGSGTLPEPFGLRDVVHVPGA
jgi:glycosyltransferase involved in cell wall biosynthesis